MKPVEEVPHVQEPMNRLQLATLCLASLLNGFNDGSLGAILAYMERLLLSSPWLRRCGS
jgi:hypothetical protein